MINHVRSQSVRVESRMQPIDEWVNKQVNCLNDHVPLDTEYRII